MCFLVRPSYIIEEVIIVKFLSSIYQGLTIRERKETRQKSFWWVGQGVVFPEGYELF